MSNSPLVSFTKISPNQSGKRIHAIDTITIHCVVGQCSVETLGNIFQPLSKQASSNYGIGYDGRVGMYVEEDCRSWCSSDRDNDQRAVTIECASDTFAPYAVNDKVYETLISLCADICKRNGIEKLVWSTDKATRVKHLNGCNMTVHRDYANKSCPGDYLYERMGDIAAKVNAILGSKVEKVETGSGTKPTETYTKHIVYKVAAGDNLTKIAKKYGLTWQKIAADNCLANPNLIHVGQKLDIFITEEVEEPAKVEELKVGDRVMMSEDALVYGQSYHFSSFVYKSLLYVRQVSGDKVLVSTLATGDVTGWVAKDKLVKII